MSYAVHVDTAPRLYNQCMASPDRTPTWGFAPRVGAPPSASAKAGGSYSGSSCIISREKPSSVTRYRQDMDRGLSHQSNRSRSLMASSIETNLKGAVPASARTARAMSPFGNRISSL
jgi:hypothetical protein